jgi:hypothetical protein
LCPLNNQRPNTAANGYALEVVGQPILNGNKKKKPATTSMTVMATICARASEAAYWRLNSFYSLDFSFL